MWLKRINKHAFIYVLILLSSCTGLHYIPKDEKLYTGAKIQLQSTDKLKSKKTILKNAEQTLKPKPNKSFLGMRPQLWFYFIAGDSANKGIRKFIKNKLGEPPVYLSKVKPAETCKYIDAKFYNIGIFKASTSYKIQEHKKTSKIEYTSNVHNPFTVKALNYPYGTDSLDRIISASKKESLIKSGDDYNLNILKAERERLDAVLKDNGYFYFNADYLLFNADSNENTRTVDLTLTLKDEAPEKALYAYRINNIIIDPDYSLQESRTDTIIKDTILIRGVTFLGKPGIRPRVLLRSVFINKYDFYSAQKSSITLNRIMTMGNFKYANLKFIPADTSATGFLNAEILLTPMPKRTFRSEFSLVSKSNDFVGPKLNLNYRNRNLFRGAELLNLNLSGSFETQFSGKYNNLYSYEITPQVEVYIPRFIVPFRIKNPTSYYIPKTKFSISYDYLKRIDYFNLTSLQFSYGFKWKENIKTDHELNPVNINYTSLSNKSEQFNELLQANPFLKKSYEEQFIAGVFYSYTFNEQVISYQKSQFYINPTVELSGNTLSQAKKIFYGKTASPENPQSFAGSVYSQFARLTVDARNYFNFPDGNKLVVRFYTGFGIPYGNSSTLPYIKQFFSGGPNSIRAFQINSLGPGTYFQTQENTSAFLELGGDVKVESNAEYRFNIFSIVKGALFVDAGNVWLNNSNALINSQPFAFSRFYRELAIGTGFGIRFDASFFILRFDLAFPLRKPWLEENNRWVIKDINFGSSAWRNDNLVLNIAIGYPF